MNKKEQLVCSIIVLNYFGEKILETNINSLIALDYPKNKYEIIIVDNNSKDKSLEIINRLVDKYKIIKPIFLEKNYGFARGNNIGIRLAKGKYIILLNNDCIVNKSWLRELVKTADKDKNIFAVSSKLVLFDTNKLQNAGIMVFQDGYGRDIGAAVRYQSQDYEEDTGQFDKEKEIYAACGAAVLYQKKILDKIGLLDENFFMYYEDVEISERARLNGYKAMYCPTGIVYHHHAMSSKEWSSSFIYNAEKGRLLHIFYHFPSSIFLNEYLNFISLALLRFFKEILIFNNYKKNQQYFKVIFYFIGNFFRLIIRRKGYHHDINPKVINQNYYKILNGDWYFNQ